MHLAKFNYILHIEFKGVFLDAPCLISELVDSSKQKACYLVASTGGILRIVLLVLI